jgi:hypothetical protein
MVDLNAITDRGSLELADTGTPGSLINHAGQIVARGKDGNSSVHTRTRSSSFHLARDQGTAIRDLWEDG